MQSLILNFQAIVSDTSYKLNCFTMEAVWKLLNTRNPEETQCEYVFNNESSLL